MASNSPKRLIPAMPRHIYVIRPRDQVNESLFLLSYNEPKVTASATKSQNVRLHATLVILNKQFFPFGRALTEDACRVDLPICDATSP